MQSFDPLTVRRNRPTSTPTAPTGRYGLARSVAAPQAEFKSAHLGRDSGRLRARRYRACVDRCDRSGSRVEQGRRSPQFSLQARPYGGDARGIARRTPYSGRHLARTDTLPDAATASGLAERLFQLGLRFVKVHPRCGSDFPICWNRFGMILKRISRVSTKRRQTRQPRKSCFSRCKEFYFTDCRGCRLDVAPCKTSLPRGSRK